MLVTIAIFLFIVSFCFDSLFGKGGGGKGMKF